MSTSKSNFVVISEETAKAFLPRELRKHGGVDLKQLVGKARGAIKDSDASLKAAGDIANSNVLVRIWKSGELAKHVVQAIGHIRDISQVNLALSAVCNDLASANLLHAERIDANHRATSQQLDAVQTAVGALLAQLRAAPQSALVEPLAQTLGSVDASDMDAVHGWLHAFSSGIDQQYLALQDRISQLAEQPKVSSEEIQNIRQETHRLTSEQQQLRADSERIDMEIGRLGSELKTVDSESTHRLAQLQSQLEGEIAQLEQLGRSLGATVRQSHEKLAGALSVLNERVERQKSEFARALHEERHLREQALSVAHSQAEERERALATTISDLRTTISALNRHLLKRIGWVAGGLFAVQLAGFVYLGVHIGLWK